MPALDMKAYFQSLADRLIEGDLEGVIAHYRFPLVVYEPAGIEIHKTAQDTSIRLAQRLMSLRSGGAVSVQVQLDETGPPRNKRQPFDVTKTYLDCEGRPVGETRLRYFCRNEDGQMRVELIEISQGFRMNALPRGTAVSH